MNKGILLVVSGPSGVGKGTVCKYLTETRARHIPFGFGNLKKTAGRRG